MPMGPHRNKDDARTDCFNVTGLGIALKRVRASLALQIAAVVAQMPQRRTAFHSTVTVSRVTPLGRPRSASARRSRRMRAIAAARLFRAAAFVRPSPFAPGTSGQYATNHLPSRSIISVNSFGAPSERSERGYPGMRSECRAAAWSAWLARDGHISPIPPELESTHQYRIRQRQTQRSCKVDPVTKWDRPWCNAAFPPALLCHRKK